MPFNTAQALEAYRRMERIRCFEEAAQELYLGGKIPGACHCSIGQEAAIVGACMALRDDDYITGTHRSHGHPIGKGAELNGLMAELMCKKTGICKGRGGSMHLADNSVGIVGESAIVGGGIPLATGCGLSAQARGTDQVSLAFFGDGASNQGTFHESINMAAVWKLPVIYFCENNGYAITTSVKDSHGQPDIARRAEGYGIPGYIIDGQDVEAVYEVTEAAVKRARAGGGPTLIEAKTYRFDEHNVGLDIIGEPYRADSEIQDYINNKDPLKLFQQVLQGRNVTQEDLQSIRDEVRKAVLDAVAFAERSDFPEASELYDYMYSNPINYPATSTH
ncbi:thiamine pyrophosphate-dependent dehydrogenase E1 component subunit alpha [Porticoccaceae bacterium]|nr:thiamine pyrophosphate-dependent dehydrogenase E1 component subunit alpha [Porticoccaceae bacterium]